MWEQGRRNPGPAVRRRMDLMNTDLQYFGQRFENRGTRGGNGQTALLFHLARVAGEDAVQQGVPIGRLEAAGDKGGDFGAA